MDNRQILSVIGAIESSLTYVSEDSAAVSGPAFADAYERYRKEVRSWLTGEMLVGFDRIFQPWTEKAPRAIDIVEGAAFTARAKEKLAALKGWLDGFVAESQLRANAEAYAAARIKEERGVGFRPSE